MFDSKVHVPKFYAHSISLVLIIITLKNNHIPDESIAQMTASGLSSEGQFSNVYQVPLKYLCQGLGM